MRKDISPPLPKLPPAKPEEIGANKQVSMSNALTRAAHGLLLSEKRLIMMGIANTDQNMSIGPNEGWYVEIHAADYAARFDIKVDTAYTQIKMAASKLFTRYVRSTWWMKPASQQTNELYFRWVSSAEYLPTEGKVVLNFTPEIVPHLINLEREFTSYKLKAGCKFESNYAWRLYELLISYVSQQDTKEFGVREFRSLMDTPPSLEKNFGLLRVNVIEPAVTQINKNSDLIIEAVDSVKGKDGKEKPVFFKAIKKGRRIVGIKFKFKMNKEKKLTVDKNSSKQKVKKDVAGAPTEREIRAEFVSLKSLAEQVGGSVEEMAGVQQKERFRKLGLI